MAAGAEEHGLTSRLLTSESTQPSCIIDLPSPEVCVICLDRVSEKAVALPCGHDQFDFPCLGTWLQQQKACPLCKRTIRWIRYDIGNVQGSKIFPVADEDLPQKRVQDIRHQRVRARQSGCRGSSQVCSDVAESDAVEFRRQVYSKGLYSKHVGTNRVSGYRSVSPEAFRSQERLVSRAKLWIRRELSVFAFLNPNSDAFGRGDRRASNAEFLLEYIVAILKSIDIKSSTGQAEELLSDFLGRDNAKLFLHELEAWLKSPYERLTDWDGHVQYPRQHV